MAVPVGTQEVGLGHLPTAPTDERAPPRAEHGVDRIGQERDAVLRVGLPDPVRAQVREVAELRLARRELLLHRAHAGDVLHDARHPHGLAVLVALRPPDAADPDDVAVRTHPAELDARLAAAAQRAPMRFLPALLVVRVDVGEELGRRWHRPAGRCRTGETPRRSSAACCAAGRAPRTSAASCSAACWCSPRSRSPSSVGPCAARGASRCRPSRARRSPRPRTPRARRAMPTATAPPRPPAAGPRPPRARRHRRPGRATRPGTRRVGNGSIVDLRRGSGVM